MLTIVLEYLKTKHLEIKGVALPGEWKLEPMCLGIQQANTKDCRVFVCMYMDFIYDGCEFNFDLDESFTSEDMRKWMTMMLLIQTHEKNMKEPDDSDGDECIVIDLMTFSARAKKIIMKSKWKQSFKLVWNANSTKVHVLNAMKVAKAEISAKTGTYRRVGIRK